ncbi:serine/threonine-protein kinase [Actinomadura parmotrematis]|uniref:Serine/threonine protein kinase n=1 Tax=Actinomadura parmotrematis TaxID=2864039 RepID=A0ABS7FVL5_9ACTN|nr:serine/threonine-protein kinase [Actinomadura parmotrematis]MBW8484475.1 serine/threonine protein kinase [Actinomadura parmotrematis]
MGTHRRLGGYRLLDEIGRGSTAVVYLAMDSTGREVAVKEISPEFAADPEARRRLAREVAAQARVDSPHVARLLDARIDGDRPFLVTQYVPGAPLGDLVETYGPVGAPRLPRLARSMALGLAAVHDAGVLHRDLSPHNVMVLNDRPVLVDFGIALGQGAEQVTKAGMVIGTPAYLAPEIIEGGRASRASDLFAYAATLAYAATGRPPFGRGSLHGVCFRILRGQSDLDGIAEPLAALIRRGLHRDPAERPSARWFAGAFAGWRDGAGPGGGPGGGGAERAGALAAEQG